MSSKNNSDLLAGCGALSIIAVLMLIIAPVSYIVHGLVLKQLWTWFVTETFGIMPISSAQAIGLSLIVGFLTHQSCKQEKPKDLSAAISNLLMAIAIGPLVVLGVGYVVHLFIG